MPRTTFPGGIIAPLAVAGVPVASLTNNSGGAVSNTVAVIGATYVQAEVANAIASLTAKVNQIIAAQAS